MDRYSFSKALPIFAGGGGGVRAIPDPWKRPRELPSYRPIPNSGPQIRQVSPEDPGNRVLPGWRPFGAPLKGNHDDVRGQGLRSQRKHHPPILIHGRATRGGEGVSSNTTDHHPAPQDQNGHQARAGA